MAKIKVNLNGAYSDGKLVTFKAPCNCTRVDGLIISYPQYNGSEYVETNVDFTFKDAAGNDVIELGNLFAEGAYVSAILDTTNRFAFLQNANTNSYIESRFDERGRQHLFVNYPSAGHFFQESEILRESLSKGLYVFHVKCEFNDSGVDSIGNRRFRITVGGKTIASVESPAAEMGSYGVITETEWCGIVPIEYVENGQGAGNTVLEEVVVYASSDDYTKVRLDLIYFNLG